MNPSSATNASSAEVLLSRMERVRVLASQLVRQAADHDDLVQEVVARALANPTQLVGDPEPWIRRVLKNLAIDRQRSNARRRDHEGASQDVDAAAQSTADSVARAEKQRDLVNAVLKLKEPYRSVILKRFFDGLPPREISKVMGVPVATVKKQQERGMLMLRKELEDRYGDRGSWAVALLPLLPKSALKSLSPGGVAWLSARSLTMAGAGAAVCAVAWVAVLGPDRSGGGLDGGALAPPAELGADGSGTQIAEMIPVGDPASELVSIASPAQEDGPAPRIGRVFRGAFVNIDGDPVPGVTAQCRLGEVRSEAVHGERSVGSAAGVVEATLDAPPSAFMVARVEADGYAPAEFRFRPNGAGEAADVAALDVGVQTLYAEADLEVRVLNTEGEPLLGWTMSYFYYGGGSRLEIDKAASDTITGVARFEGIASASVEVGAEHPSGLSLHHPRRRLSADEPNRIDLVHVGPNPDRRLGLDLEFPPSAAMPDSEPVELQLVQRGEVIRRGEAATNASVAFDDLGPGAYEVRVEDPRFEPLAMAARVGESTKVRLRGSSAIDLEVKGRGGRIVNGFEVEQVSVDGRVALRLRSDVVGGTRFGDLVPSGPFSLVVTAPEGYRAAVVLDALRPRETRVVSVTLGEGVTDLKATVVRGSAKKPVAGAAVAFVRGALPRASKAEAAILKQLKFTASDSDVRLLGRGRTDESGSVTLPVPTAEAQGVVTAIALAGDHATGAVVGQEVQLNLAELGRLRVTLQGAPDGLPAGAALTVGESSSGSAQLGSFGPGRVLARGEDGLWFADDVPCGESVLRLVFSDFNHKGRGTTLGGISGPVGYPLGVVSVDASTQANLTVDVSDWMPGSVRLEVMEAGLPVRDAIVELEPSGSHVGLPDPTTPGAQVSRRLVQITDGRGQAHFPVVPKGSWRIRVRDANWLWTQELGLETIGPGAKIERALSLQLVEDSVAWLDQLTGAPSANHEVWLEPRSGVRVLRRTDDEGRLTLRLGAGTYRLFASQASKDPAATLEWGPAGGVLRY